MAVSDVTSSTGGTLRSNQKLGEEQAKKSREKQPCGLKGGRSARGRIGRGELGQPSILKCDGWEAVIPCDLGRPEAFSPQACRLSGRSQQGRPLSRRQGRPRLSR